MIRAEQRGQRRRRQEDRQVPGCAARVGRGVLRLDPWVPGCVSQGDTEEEALENIADALRDYLEVTFDNLAQSGVKARAIEIAV